MSRKRYGAEGGVIWDYETGRYTRALTPEGASIIVRELREGRLDPDSLNWRTP